VWAKRENVSPSQLLYTRSPLLNALPNDTIWYKVSINKNDLDSLKVINGDFNWQIVSDNSWEIKRITSNLDKLSKCPPKLRYSVMPNGRTSQQYVSDLIKKLQTFRNKAGAKDHNLALILISSTKNGPFTILEGNHTAVGLYFRYFIDHPELPYPTHDSYVGVSPSMKNCRWYHSS